MNKEALSTESIISSARTSLSSSPGDRILLQAKSESWFSNQLAWLLDASADHGLGVLFIREFLKCIGEKRTTSRTTGRPLKERSDMLKTGKKGKGVGTTHLTLGNCSVFREYYLPHQVTRRRNTGYYCDVVVMDLDSRDGLFLVIENKIFTAEGHEQLEKYSHLVKTKFEKAKIREYVFLTLSGHTPSGDREHLWVPLSWAMDIRNVLQTAISRGEKRKGPLVREIEDLLSLLNWIHALSRSDDDTRQAYIDLSQQWKTSVAECLMEELVRLGTEKPGSWCWNGETSYFEHTSRKARLHLSLLPGLAITLQGRSGKKTEFDKILLPFGSHPDQFFHLIDLAAREIYHLFFHDSSRYLGPKRRRWANLTPGKKKWKPLLTFIHQARYI